MAKIILFLLLLIIRSNVYAAWCSWNQSQSGYIQNLYCSEEWAYTYVMQSYWCPSHTGDPSCSAYVQPVCQNQVEYQTLACPIHQSGAINQSRTYTCSTQSWSDWTTTSNNCTPDPPTCIESTETRQLSCLAGYEGSIQEQRNSICSDPYGSPIWTAWSTILDTCKMTATNINNPVSPISPISPTNPNSVVSQSTSSITMTSDIELVQQPIVIEPSVSLNTTSSTSGSTTVSSATQSSTQSSPNNTSSVQTTEPRKEIVPGFGIVLSMQLLNAPYTMQQQQMDEYISLEQENEYGRIQEFTLSLLSETNVGDRFNLINRSRWTNLLRNNPLQRLAEYD